MNDFLPSNHLAKCDLLFFYFSYFLIKEITDFHYGEKRYPSPFHRSNEPKENCYFVYHFLLSFIRRHNNQAHS